MLVTTVIGGYCQVPEYEHVPAGSMSAIFAKDLKKVAKVRGCYISDDEVAAMVIPNTPAFLSCYAWLKD